MLRPVVAVETLNERGSISPLISEDTLLDGTLRTNEGIYFIFENYDICLFYLFMYYYYNLASSVHTHPIASYFIRRYFLLNTFEGILPLSYDTIIIEDIYYLRMS